MLLLENRAAEEPAAFQKSTAVGQQKAVYQSHGFRFCSPIHTFTFTFSNQSHPAQFLHRSIITGVLILGRSLAKVSLLVKTQHCF